MISSIHPLYILGIMLLLLVNLIWKNSDIENNIAREHADRASMTVLAKRIVELKKVMKTPETSQIEKFLKTPQFGGVDLKHQIKNGRYVIDAKSIDARQMQTLLNYLLNMSVTVSQLKIERIDELQASLYMEINL